MHISEPLSSHKHTKLMKMKVNIVAAKYNVSQKYLHWKSKNSAKDIKLIYSL